jgi:hypothetical protein
MRALPVVLLLVLATPALADTPTPAKAPEAAKAPDAPAGDAPAPAPAGDAPEAVDDPEPIPAPPKKLRIVPPSTIAPAGGDPVPAEPELTRTKYGYRWQLIAADAAVIGLSFIVDQVSSDGGERPGGLATLTIASYFFAAPMIHGIHRQGKRALGSFAMRAGLPLLLGLLGEQLDGTPKCDICEDTLRSDGKLIGLTAGVLISMAVDTTLLARPIYRRVERKPQTVWAPALRGVRGGATAGVFGTF